MNLPATRVANEAAAPAYRPADELAPVGLLHNMSSRPTTAVQLRGVNRCRALRVGVAEALKAVGVASGDINGLCRCFGLETNDGKPANKALAAFLHATARESSLPAVAPALREPEKAKLSPRAARIDDLALALAVAAKSSRSVFVRSKSPIVSEIWARDLIVLLLPESPSAPSRTENNR